MLDLVRHGEHFAELLVAGRTRANLAVFVFELLHPQSYQLAGIEVEG